MIKRGKFASIAPLSVLLVFLTLSVLFTLIVLTSALSVNVLIMTGGGSRGAYEGGLLASLISKGKDDYDIVSGISV